MNLVINVIVANGTITMSRVTGEFFELIEICRIPRARARARTCRGGLDSGDNMQMRLLRHKRTQLSGANGRTALLSAHFTLSVALTR